MTAPSDSQRIDAVRQVARHVAVHLQADLSLELWTGEVIPHGDGARDDIRIVLRSPAAIRRLMLKPSLMTVWELYATGLIDITGASPLAAIRRWEHMRAVRLTKNISKTKILRALWPFMLSAGSSGAVAAYDDAVRARYGAGRDDKAMIAFHYDASNAMYGLFLDPEMVYSCAYFATPETSLEAAQLAKLDRICRKLQLKPGDDFLDIGCGWGGLVCHAAKNFGVNAHGVTLSQQQFEFVQAKIARLGLTGKVKVELRDYRSLTEGRSYDKIAQIEMFEHLGIDNHDRHFAQMHHLLRPRGLYLHQASTRMATRDLGRFRKTSHYMKALTRFVFPGGEMDYVGMSTTNLERHGFEVHDVEALREHFYLTLQHWIARLYGRMDEAAKDIGMVRARHWLAYLVLSAMGFERNGISCFQTLASRRRNGPSRLPLARADYAP